MISDLLRPTHLVLLLILFVLIFGTKKLPEFAKAIGRSMRVLKEEISIMTNHTNETDVKKKTVGDKKEQ